MDRFKWNESPLKTANLDDMYTMKIDDNIVWY